MTETDQTYRVERDSLVGRFNNWIREKPLAHSLMALGAVGVVALLAIQHEADTPATHEKPPETSQDIGEQYKQYREAFFANIADHAPRAVCKNRVGYYGSMEALAEEEAGDANRWPDFIKESPFSHWSSVASGTNGQVVNQTSGRSTIDIALDAELAGKPRGTNQVCTYDPETKTLSFVESESEIYPSGNPEASVVQDIIASTVAIEQTGTLPEPNGGGIIRKLSAVHVGGGRYLTRWVDDYLKYTYPDSEKEVITPVTSATLRGFGFEDESILDSPISRLSDEHYSVIHTDQVGPELKLGDTTDIEPGDTLILSGYDEHEALTHDATRFIYRVVVLEKRENGELVVATDVEDSGSYDPSNYHPDTGAVGAGVFTIDGTLVGTLGAADTYQYSYDSDSSSRPDDEAFWANQVIDILSQRLGYPTPQELRDQSYDSEGSYQVIPEPAFTSIAIIDPLPLGDIEQLSTG